MEKVLTSKLSLTAVADAIRKQTKSTEQIPFPNGFVSEIEKIDVESSYNNGYQQGYTEGETKGEEQGYSRGYGEGQKAEYDMFWDALQDYGNRTRYSYGFCSSSWNDTTFKPKYDIKASNCIFMDSHITDLKAILEECGVILDFSSCTNFGNSCGSSKITKLPTIDAKNFDSNGILYTFNRSDIEEVTIINVQPNLVWKESFVNCSKLHTLLVTGSIGTACNIQYSPLLSNESVQSIIDALIDLTDKSTLTLSLHKDVKAKLTETQIAQITSKNWTLA